MRRSGQPGHWGVSPQLGRPQIIHQLTAHSRYHSSLRQILVFRPSHPLRQSQSDSARSPAPGRGEDPQGQWSALRLKDRLTRTDPSGSKGARRRGTQNFHSGRTLWPTETRDQHTLVAADRLQRRPNLHRAHRVFQPQVGRLYWHRGFGQ